MAHGRLQSFQEVLDRRRWNRQLLMRRVAALWMYTEFFMMTGILASSSAFRMHSSKNPGGRKYYWFGLVGDVLAYSLDDTVWPSNDNL